MRGAVTYSGQSVHILPFGCQLDRGHERYLGGRHRFRHERGRLCASRCTVHARRRPGRDLCGRGSRRRGDRGRDARVPAGRVAQAADATAAAAITVAAAVTVIVVAAVVAVATTPAQAVSVTPVSAAVVAAAAAAVTASAMLSSPPYSSSATTC